MPKQNSLVVDISPVSSRTSSPDHQRRNSRQDSIASTMSGGSGFGTPQTQLLQKTKEFREHQVPSAASSLKSQQIQTQNTTMYSPDKPPIPPRGLPPPLPQRQISSNESVQLRNRNGIMFCISMIFES